MFRLRLLQTSWGRVFQAKRTDNQVTKASHPCRRTQKKFCFLHWREQAFLIKLNFKTGVRKPVHFAWCNGKVQNLICEHKRENLRQSASSNSHSTTHGTEYDASHQAVHKHWTQHRTLPKRVRPTTEALPIKCRKSFAWMGDDSSESHRIRLVPPTLGLLLPVGTTPSYCEPIRHRETYLFWSFFGKQTLFPK